MHCYCTADLNLCENQVFLCYCLNVTTYTEVDLGSRVKLFFRLITGEGLGLAGWTYSFLLRLGEAEGILV